MPKQDKLKKARELLDLVNNGLTKTDFVTSFKGVIDYVKRFETAITRDFKILSKTLTYKINDIKLDQKATDDLKERLNARVLSLKDGRDGYTPIKGQDYFDGRNGLDGKDGSPDTPEQIRDKISLLEDDRRLSIGHIHGLEEALSDGKRRIADLTAIGVNRPQMTYIDISSQLNGVLTTFNTQSFQRVIQISLSSFPNILRPNVDFTTAQQPPSITFIGAIAANAATILAVGQTCIVLVLA